MECCMPLATARFAETLPCLARRLLLRCRARKAVGASRWDRSIAPLSSPPAHDARNKKARRNQGDGDQDELWHVFAADERFATSSIAIQECEDRAASNEQNQSKSGNDTTRNHGLTLLRLPTG